MNVAGVAVIFAILIAVLFFFFLSLVRKWKANQLFENSIVYVMYDGFKSLFDGRRYSKHPHTKVLFYRQLTFILLSAIVMFIEAFLCLVQTPWLLVWPIVELILIFWLIKANNRTYAAINLGFNESLEEQMKAERMKIALVTNVSHDLKTPLTSIISYVDLLSKEEQLSDVARDYVAILTEKSDRLKHIVADLFDLAKSTSGEMSLEFEELDLKKLLEQTLADMEDDITKSGLPLKLKLPEQPVMIHSDGKKLYRVLQNVLDNALKYSLQGTRIHVELDVRDNKVALTVKNTANYEMDFTSEEILQRFYRGDKSRSTDGSGLGLSIAESFTRVCGGQFRVEIDGDLFKVVMSL
jgi:signal transduction histidine kinase